MTDRRSFRAYRGLLWALIALPVLGLSVCALAVATLSTTTDRVVEANTRAMISGALAYQIATNSHTIREYGIWNDAFEHLHDRVDARWASTNLATTTANFLIDRTGKTLLGVGRLPISRKPLEQVSPEGLAALLERLPKTFEASRHLKTGVAVLAEIEGRPALLAAMPLISLRDQSHRPASTLRYIVLTQPIGDAVLAEWAKVFRLDGLRWQRTIALEQHSQVLAIKGSNGRRLGYVTWRMVPPSRVALQKLAPLIAGLVTVFLGLSAWLIWRVRNAERELLARTRAARSAAVEAAANLELARQAQSYAEHARMQAERYAEEIEVVARLRRSGSNRGEDGTTASATPPGAARAG